MNKQYINWNSLPLNTKKELKRIYNIHKTLSNNKSIEDVLESNNIHEAIHISAIDTLEYFFGKDNLIK